MVIRLSIFFFLLTISSVSQTVAYATDKVRFTSDILRISLTTRTPQQISAFYEARGFQKAMLKTIRQYCFITVYIKNRSKHIVWHDLQTWQFISNGEIVQRMDRIQFKRLWSSMQIPLAHQSTFRWTLLPEQLDFRPNEAEGGNIVLPWVDKPISIHATFNTRNDKSEKSIKIKLDNISCKK